MVRTFGTVLVATDCSEDGNRVIPFAYSIVAPGGTVHLIHVIEHDENANPLYSHYSAGDLYHPANRKAVAAEVEGRLRALIPAEAGENGVRTLPNAVFHQEVAAGIVAESIARKAEALVLGTHGRTGLSRMLLGSVAEEVLRRCSIPVLIIPTGKAPTS